jgi:hypothetical protein
MPNAHSKRFKYLQWITNIQLVVAPENTPPFDVQAFVYEQDTTLVLKPTREIKEPAENSETLINQALEMQPLTPGSVLVQGQFPIQLFAIVHDLDQEPTWQEEWIVQALHNILHESEQRQFQSMGIPFLGTVHGSLSKQRFLMLLRSVLEKSALVHLKRLWLIVSTPHAQNFSHSQITYH